MLTFFINFIQNDINKFTKTYGIEKIMPKKEDNISKDINDINSILIKNKKSRKSIKSTNIK